jgi:hypothetical protein
MSATEAYLSAARQAVALLQRPEVAAAWDQPSTLPEMTVGGLAGHLAYQIFSVGSALEEPASDQPPIPLLEHYARTAWMGAPLDGEVNAASGRGPRVSAPRGRRRCGSAPAPRSLSSGRRSRGCPVTRLCSCPRPAGR